MIANTSRKEGNRLVLPSPTRLLRSLLVRSEHFLSVYAVKYSYVILAELGKHQGIFKLKPFPSRIIIWDDETPMFHHERPFPCYHATLVQLIAEVALDPII